MRLKISKLKKKFFYFLGKNLINGEIALRCYQDLQNGQPNIDRSENMVLFGPCRIPFSIQSTSNEDLKCSEGILKDAIQKKILIVNPGESFKNNMGRFETSFSLLFRYEGVHKIRPEIFNLKHMVGKPNLGEDDIFLPTISFNVITKLL